MKTARVGFFIVAFGLAAFGGSFLGGAGGQAQEASPPRPSHIHSGDCDELGEVVQPLNSLTVPVGDCLRKQRRRRGGSGLHQHPAASRRAAGGGPRAQGSPFGRPDPDLSGMWRHRRRGGRRWRADRRHEGAGRLRIRGDRLPGPGRRRLDQCLGNDRPGLGRRDRRRRRRGASGRPGHARGGGGDGCRAGARRRQPDQFCDRRCRRS